MGFSDRSSKDCKMAVVGQKQNGAFVALPFRVFL